MPPRSRTPRLAAPTRALGLLLSCLSCLFCLSCRGPTAEPDGSAGVAQPETSLLLGPPRQLTFDGRRSGEGYFSRDGSALVFQSEREPGNPFFQIYWMDLEKGDVSRVSPGIGKTTCGWIHPSGKRVLFASTHHDPNSEALQTAETLRRASGPARRYEWDYDPHYDLFSVRVPAREGDRPIPLTDAFGYDAEASWSPDGRFVVFASNRHIYQEDGSFSPDLSKDERERAEIEPQHFIDLYIMDARGKNPRRLTTHAGYDGGPFFSPDGKRLVFRRFDAGGERAEIYTIAIDGTDEKQLTRLDAMSWAPFYHPSGDYVIFTTNVHGFGNFELYAVVADGRSAPVRVTQQQGADLLPVFSPAGDEVFYTRKPKGGQSQIYRAAWNDDRARSRLGLPARSFHGAGPLLAVPSGLSADIDPDELRTLVDDLSSDAAEGRLTGSRGEKIATGYVARVFRSLGLVAAGDGGSFFHEFGFTAGVSLGPDNTLRAKLPDAPGSRDFTVDREWRPLSFSRVGEVPASEVVFASYGLVAPGDGQRGEVDDYAHLDVRDKWVMVLRYMPEGLDDDARRQINRQSSLRYKAMVARDKGARGILFVSGPGSKVREELVGLRFDASLAGTSVAVASLTDLAADALIQAGSGHNLADLQAALDRGIAMPGFELEGVTLQANVDIQQQRKKGRNVLAKLPASRPPRIEDDGSRARVPAVVIGAHIDHLGRGEGAGSLARGDELNEIHRGADDNASGVAALLEIAHHLATQQAEGRLETERDIVFAAWSGEELGLLGSAAWARELLENTRASDANPDDPHEDLSGEIAAYLNMDMVGRLRGHLTLLGVDSSPAWSGQIEQQNVPVGLAIVTVGDSYLPTDATSFYLRRVPVLSAFTGSHAEYHTPRDVPDELDYDGLAAIARLVEGIAASLASSEDPPTYAASANPGHGLPRAGLRVSLGTIPDYSQGIAIPGVKLSGVAPGGPAETAGVRTGDIVIELEGKRIENLYDYTFAIEGLEVGVAVKMVVRRGDSQAAFVVTPASRD